MVLNLGVVFAMLGTLTYQALFSQSARPPRPFIVTFLHDFLDKRQGLMSNRQWCSIHLHCADRYRGEDRYSAGMTQPMVANVTQRRLDITFFSF